ncbi:MAG: hypothetical protein L0Z63_11520 [Actinobacteria bacterium]|nr:hypothetical protein [Actinomycetota bacterium]
MSGWIPVGGGGGGGSGVGFAKAIGDGSGNRTTTSTTFVDLADMSITIAAVAGDELEIKFNCSAHNSNAARQLSFQATIAGTAINPVSEHTINHANLVQIMTHLSFHTVASGDISGGTVAVKIQWKVSANTGTVVNEAGSSGARRPVLIVTNTGQ